MAVKVLFVCLGNICRSPLAEGIFLDLVQKAGLSDQIAVDSAGTSGYHDGKPADPRSQKTALAHGITLTGASRTLLPSDFARFDYIAAMDSSNAKNIETARPAKNVTTKVFLMRNFDPENRGADVPDPYYGGEEGFEKVYEMLDRSCASFLLFLRKKHEL